MASMKPRYRSKSSERVGLEGQTLPLFITNTCEVRYLSMASKPFTLYLLMDPLTREICYAGQTVLSPTARYQQHCQDMRGVKNKPKGLWLASLFDLGFWPTLVVVETCSGAEVNRRERQLVTDLWDADCPLVNQSYLRIKKSNLAKVDYCRRLSNSEWARTRGLSEKVGLL